MVGVNLIAPRAIAAPRCRRCAASARARSSTSRRVYGVTGRKGMGLYDATKAAILALTRTLAHEEVVHGIRANAVCPGSTLTDFHIGRATAAGKSIEQLRSERDTSSLIGRWAAPTRSPGRSSSSPARRRPSSPAPRCWSTAGLSIL